MIVLDASLLIARILSEHHPGLDADLYDTLDASQITVPSHWSTEIANALWTNVRRGRISQRDIDSIVGFLARFQVTIAAPPQISDIAPLTKFAAEFSLTAYDAAYVRIALTHRAQLATVDRAMRAAAERLRISLLPS